MKRRLLLGMVGLYLMHVPFLSLLMSMEGDGTEGLLTDRGEQKPQQGRDDVFSEKAVFLELASLCAFKPEAASGLCYKSVFVVSRPGGWRTAPKPSYRETYSIVNRRTQEAERTISEQCGFLCFSPWVTPFIISQDHILKDRITIFHFPAYLDVRWLCRTWSPEAASTVQSPGVLTFHCALTMYSSLIDPLAQFFLQRREHISQPSREVSVDK